MASPLRHTCHFDNKILDKTKGCILWIHGGCFTSGDNTWSKKITQHLVAQGYIVYTVDFPQGPFHPWPGAVKPLVNMYDFVLSKNKKLACHVGGESSGALYAYYVAAQRIGARCVILCPVVDPYARYLRLTPAHAKCRKQLAYFQTEAMMKTASITNLPTRPAQTVAVVGDKDKDAEYATCMDRLDRVVIIQNGTHRLCSAPTISALEAISQAFEHLAYKPVILP